MKRRTTKKVLELECEVRAEREVIADCVRKLLNRDTAYKRLWKKLNKVECPVCNGKCYTDSIATGLTRFPCYYCNETGKHPVVQRLLAGREDK